MILAGGDADAVITANMLPQDVGSMVPAMPNGNGGEQLMGLPLREAREMFEREYLRGADQPLRRQYLAHRRVRRHGALGAAPQAQGAGHRLTNDPDKTCFRARARFIQDHAQQNPAPGINPPCHASPMSTAATCRSRTRGACRGPRLSVRRRRLRSVRGEGRPAGRRAPAHATGSQRSLANCASPCRCRATRSARGAARDRAAQPGARRHRLSADHAAAWRAATMRFRRPARAPSIVVTARSCRPRPRREARRRRHRGHHGAGQPLGARRHQVGVAAAQRAGQAGGARAGRPRGLVRRRGGLRHRGLLVQRLDRDAATARWSPGRPTTASCAASPARSCSR